MFQPPISSFIDQGETALGVLPKIVGDQGSFLQVALLATPVNTSLLLHICA